MLCFYEYSSPTSHTSRVVCSPTSSHRQKAGTSIVLEPVDKWQRVESCAQTQPFNILDEFYEDPKRYAYTFQNYVFMTRYLQEIESRNADVPLRIMERSVFSDRMIFVESVHEKGWISDLELSIFNGWYDPVVKVRDARRPFP